MILIRLLISIILSLITFVLSNYIIDNCRYIKVIIRSRIEKTKLAKNIRLKLEYLNMYIIPCKINKFLDSVIILIFSLIISFVTYLLSINFVKILSTSIILSMISFFVPYFIINCIVNNNIRKIKTILPSYIINLKNNMEVTNNIIKTIKITKVDSPLEYSINRFNFKVERGINVKQCFDELKDEIKIGAFNSLVDTFKVCYENGGDFISVLTKYVDIISKENIEKSKLKENSSSTITTLVVMIIINLILLFSVVLSNPEYNQIILKTTMGHVIINFSIISYLIVMYFVYKIYRMEG